MRASYTPEQKARAIEVYDKTKSHAKTLRILGYPSRHVLFDWVKHPQPKPKPKRSGRPAKRRGRELKSLAAAKVLDGADIKVVADELGVANHAAICERVRKWRTEGDVGLTGKKEQAADALDAAKQAALKNRDSPESLVLHTDRGGHYRGAAWIGRLEGLGITRSMSRKGNSGDNAACEGFFARLKTEMRYGIEWKKTSGLEAAIDEYIDFYNNRRITAKLDGTTIAERRDMLAKVSKKAS